MPTTTSLTLSSDLMPTIAKVAAMEGKTSHALAKDAVQAARDDAVAHPQFFALGEAAYQETLRSGTVYGGAAVKEYVMARIAGSNPNRPPTEQLN